MRARGAGRAARARPGRAGRSPSGEAPVVVLSGRPGVEVGRIDAPDARGTSRDEVVTDPEFVLRREEIMSLLRESR